MQPFEALGKGTGRKDEITMINKKGENVHVETLPNIICKGNVNDPITWSPTAPIEEWIVTSNATNGAEFESVVERAEALIEKMDRIIEKLDEVIKAMEVRE